MGATNELSRLNAVLEKLDLSSGDILRAKKLVLVVRLLVIEALEQPRMLARVIELARHEAKIACAVVLWVAVNVVYLILLRVFNGVKRHTDETRNLNAPSPLELWVIVGHIDILVLISRLPIDKRELMEFLAIRREYLTLVAY